MLINCTIRLTENVSKDGIRQELVYLCRGSKIMSMARTFEVDSLVVSPKQQPNLTVHRNIGEQYECYCHGQNRAPSRLLAIS